MSEDDHFIIERIIKGDRDSYAILVDKYKAPIFNLAFRMTGSYEDASDIAQETFLKAFESLRRFDRKKRFFTWLYTIGLNLTRNHLKKRKLTLNPVAETSNRTENGPPDSEKNMILEEDLLRLDACLKRLSVKLREAVVLRFYQDLTFDEIAEITSSSVSSVKMRVYRGLEELERMMKK